MVVSPRYRLRTACSIALACWISSTSLSSPTFAETLPYRADGHDAVTVNDTPQDNPYQQRRKRFKAEAAVLPSPDLLKPAPVATAKIEPATPPKSQPMKITIPDLKALAEQRGLPMPALLGTQDTAADTSPAATTTPSHSPSVATSALRLPVNVPPTTADTSPTTQPEQTATAEDRPRQTVPEFKPMTPSATESVNANAVAEQFAALAPAAGEAAAEAQIAASTNTPLIAAPEESAPVAATPPASPTSPVAPSVVATAPAPPPPQAAVPPTSPAPPEPEGKAVPDPAPAATAPSEPAPSPVTQQALDTALAASGMSEVPEELPPLTQKKSAASKKNKGKKTTPASAKPAYSPLDSEPLQGLSGESKSMLKKIPSNLDKPKASPANALTIDRAKDLEAISKPEENTVSSTVTHEAMGIKIEVKNHSPNLDYELEKAYNALVSGQPSLAMEIYKNVLENDPNNQGALFGLATTYHRSGQLEQARSYYRKLLSIAPRHRDGLNNFLVLLADEAPEEALKQMDELAKRNPDFSPIAAQMAVINQKLGHTDKAAEYMFRAVDLAPENLVYRYNLAIMLDTQKKYDEAAKLYKQLVEAALRGEMIPGNLQKIQQRLTFISSNRR